MINNSTIDKLIEIRLTAMSDAFRQQILDPRMNEISIEKRFGMMVDIDYTRRKNNRVDRLIRNADFEQPDASIMDINYRLGRKLNKELIKGLASCDFIGEHRKFFITGATSSGKTYMDMAIAKAEFHKRKDIFELLPRRRKKSSTLFC